ncbi:CARDB domain-containing protein [Pyxidicoccus sp. 3LFB2]
MRRDIKRAVLGALTLATVAACSDGASPEAEQKTAKQGLLDGPDFVVTVLSAPPSALPGSSFMTSLRVCNHGTWAGGTEVALVLSQDSDISLSMDGQAGSIYAGYLAPGACETHSTLLYTPPQGTWFLGAIADPYGSEPELDEGNNTRLGGPITIGYGPDFVVTGVKAPASSLPGGNLTADVTVCNQGTEPDGTAVALYLSADALPPQPEQPVAAWAAVGFIFPGQCTTVPAYGNAILPPPGTEGAYHLGARVDPDNHRLELREDNNTHVGAVMGVGHRADFVVTNVQAPASLLPGQSFTAQVTVCNQGTQPDSADVALVLSADAIIDPGTGPEPTEDVLLGQRPAGDLFPGQCVTLPMFVNATPPPPGTEGAYRLGAVWTR